MKSIRTVLLSALSIAALLSPMKTEAAREMEKLDRGVIATYNGGYPSSAVFVAWRMLGTEPNTVSYNVYRDGTKFNSTPITDSCNWMDAGGTANSTYQVSAIIDDVEQELSDPVETWSGSYLGSGQFIGCQEIPLKERTGYVANDISVGDLDGDGQYEFVLKRIYTDETPTATSYHYLEAYEFDGTFMWEINLGPNNIPSLEINPIVYDFDGDGKAEVVVRTCDGTTDGVGTYFGDRDGDGTTNYRSTAVPNTWYWMINGPEYLSVFDGETGAELTYTEYIERDPISDWGSTSLNDSQNGHRANKCMLTPAYLDGRTPSIVISRGIYEKIALEAWNYRNGTLIREWTFSSDDNAGYAQQGNHNLTVGDCDGDGYDEIVYGQMTVDHDGTGLYTTGRGHGDAIHMGKMIPDREGLQIYGVHEHPPYGADLRDAATGVAIWEHTAGGDTGRGCAAHIDSRYPGYQMWDVGLAGTYDCSTGTQISTNAVNWGNFLIWWDGDLQREILDGTSEKPIIDKWDSNNWGYRLVSLYNYPSSYATTTINSTKANPCISGDLFGDWREEAIYPSGDHTSLYLYSTATLTSHRIYTLLHDSMYRTAIAWQCNQYNQPPHPSFYIGAGMDTPPTPDIVIAGDTTPPAAPTGLTASANGSQSILTWTANSEDDLASYKIYRGSSSGGSYSLIASGVTDTSCTDNGLGDGTTRFYVIKAVDERGNGSSFSSEASATGEKDLVVYYQMENGVADGSGNGNHGTATGTPSYTTGHSGQAIDLDGSDDYATLPADLFSTTDITIMAWIYWNGGSSWQRIFDFGGGTSEYMFLSPSSGSSTLRFAITDGSGEQLVETTAFTSNLWTHVAVRIAGSTATLFVGGSSAASNTGMTLSPADITCNNNLIGDAQFAADPLFDGRIDEFMVYNYALTDTEIADIAAGLDITPPAAPTGLSATLFGGSATLIWTANTESDLADYTVYRSLTDGSGYSAIATGITTNTYTDSTATLNTNYYYVVTASDTSGNESDMSAQAACSPIEIEAFWNFEDGVNGTAFSADSDGGSVDTVNGIVMHGYSAAAGPSWTSDVPPNGGSLALYAANQDGYIWNDGNGLVQWTSPNWTIELQARVDDASPDWETFIAKMGSSFSASESDFYMQRNGSSGVFRLNYRNADGTQTILDGSTVLNSGTWYGLAIVANGDAGTISMYVDTGSGYVLDGQLTGLTGNLGVISSTYDWAFFRDYYNRGNDVTTGIMDNVRFTSGALPVSSLIPLTPTEDATAPAVPTGLGAIAGDGAVDLDWSDNVEADLAGYTVYRSTTSDSGYSPVVSNLADSACTDSAVVGEATYFYKVAATDTSGNESESSSAVEVMVMLDTDADGLSDTWEIVYFGNLSQDGTGDPDNDGTNNAEEKINGTNPGISSIPPVISIDLADQASTLNWSSNHIGWTLYSTTNLTTPDWQEVPGTTATNIYENTNSADQVFYRLEYSE